MFPLFFAALFLSSMALPRNLIQTDWFRTVATWNPVSYMLEAIRSLVIVGWDPEALALGFGVRGRRWPRSRWRPRRRRCGRGWCAREPRVLVGRAWRWPGATSTTSSPTRRWSCPALLFPLFFFTAFAGGLSRVDQIPGFDYAADYTAFVYGFVLLQASTFGGVFTGFSMARDFESGFSRRLLLAAPQPRRHRRRLLAGGAHARDLHDHGDHRPSP